MEGLGLGPNGASAYRSEVMALPFLRSDLPDSYPFSVRELPWTAKLDQNESPIDLPEEVKREIAEELCARPWNRYVQPSEYLAAKVALAEVLKSSPERLAIVSGADQGLVIAALIGGGPGRRVRWFEPSYPYIGHAARMSRGDCEAIPLADDLGVSLDAARDADLLYLVSPNNPTGALVSDTTVRQALEHRERLVVVDEAYYDFSKETSVGLLDEFDNLLIVRSLSKSLVAAWHVGYVLGSAETIAIIERVLTAPYHLTAPQLTVARRYGQIRPHVLGAVELVRRERQRVAEALEAIDGVTQVYPSHANFLLFQVGVDAKRVASALADSGVRVRDVSGLPTLSGHLRVSIGTREDNDTFLAKLEQVLG